MTGAIFDEHGIHVADAQPVIAPRPDGPWLLNTVARAQRDADAPVVALVSRHPERLAFIAGRLVVLKVKA